MASQALIVSSFATPAGFLQTTYDEHFLYHALFVKQASDTSLKPHGKLGSFIADELCAYADNPHHRFQLPLKPLGTIYQQRVWNALLAIPVGHTLTYGELATTLQSSPRAIGQACKKNPLILFIPCHRVVGKNNPGGYMGQASALHYKQALLEHEEQPLLSKNKP